jgi:hypothetical protein
MPCHRVQPVVTPSKQPTIKVQLFQLDVIQEAPELAHEPPIQLVVILVLSLVYHVENSAKQPRSRLN